VTEPGDDKELIFFVIQFMLNILCDVIRDVTDKYVYDWLIWLIGNSFGNDWLQSLQRRVDILNDILIIIQHVIIHGLSICCWLLQYLHHF